VAASFAYPNMGIAIRTRKTDAAFGMIIRYLLKEPTLD
jgi:hypothetical protein